MDGAARGARAWILVVTLAVAAAGWGQAVASAAARPQRAGAAVNLPAVPRLVHAPRMISAIGRHRALRGRQRGTVHAPAPALLPRTGTVHQAPLADPQTHHLRTGAPAGSGSGHAENVPDPATAPGPGTVSPFSAAAPAAGQRATAAYFVPSTPVSSFAGQCGAGVTDPVIAQSTANPNLVVAGAQSPYANDGTCTNPEPGVFYSSDGGRHWKYEVMPGLEYGDGNSPAITFDPVRQVFVYAFEEDDFSTGAGRIGVEVSSDGVNWSRDTTLATSASSCDQFNDCAEVNNYDPRITVDENPSSPHYGRVLVAWTECPR